MVQGVYQLGFLIQNSFFWSGRPSLVSCVHTAYYWFISYYYQGWIKAVCDQVCLDMPECQTRWEHHLA